MYQRSSSTILSALLLLFITQACHAQLTCYVCNDCEKITPDTQKLTCDSEFFNSGGTTLPSTMTTTDEPTTSTTTSTTTTSTTEANTISTTIASTEETTIDDTTTTTTEADDTTTTTEEDTTTTVSQETTNPPIPTPPTVGPPPTTITYPTPPTVQENDGIFTTLPVSPESPTPATPTILNISPISVFANQSATTKLPLLRQIRAVESLDDKYTYHCYWLNVSSDNQTIVDRGCARVKTEEDVCQVLHQDHANETISKCTPCSNNLCNGSSTFGISILTLSIGILIALLLQRN